MDKNLTWKIVLIVALVVIAAIALYPPRDKLKGGIDILGGYSVTFEIDDQGLTAAEKKGMSTKMINILRRRIDPGNIMNMIWRPLGDTRFEIQMPLASDQARTARLAYEDALTSVLNENVDKASIMRAMMKPEPEREEAFAKIAKGQQEKLDILNNLATTYDEYTKLRTESDTIKAEMKTAEDKMSASGLDIEKIKANRQDWSELDEAQLSEALKKFLGTDQAQLNLLTKYVGQYSKWAQISDQITEPETGKKALFERAKSDLDKLILTEDELNVVLDMSPGSSKRNEGIQKLKEEFPGRAEMIDAVVAAYADYLPQKGRLDDPKDLMRMLKGAGILEFRILPTQGGSDLDADQIRSYVESLSEKGPKYASDDKYKWLKIESFDEWFRVNELGQQSIKVADKEGRPAILGEFGGNFYVLASNKRNADEIMVHGTSQGRDWKLKSSRATTDQRGLRAISFTLDDKGGLLFGRLTGKNIGKPLCIVLDDFAISAPNIDSRIGTHGIITGSFSKTQVDDMVNKLNAGSLPAKLIEQPLSVKSIGPSIGAANRDQGIKAALVGLAAVILCMAIYYTLAGSIADVALLLNILFVLAIMAFAQATFTLPGIAGIILTIGMSVDANVLIFERIREEQQKGSSLRIAVRNGYERAFRTIFDANITTFLTAAILYWVASEEIKGFAIVLMLGIVSSMFTALFVTRVIFDVLMNMKVLKDHLFMLSIVKNPKVNWMKLRPVFLTISLTLIIAGLAVFFTRDPARDNKYDKEFIGGTSVVINLKDGVELTQQQVEDMIRNAAGEGTALGNATVYSIGKPFKESPDGNKYYKQYEINTTETNKTTAKVTLAKSMSKEAVMAAINRSGIELNKLTVTSDNETNTEFTVTTSETNKSLVKNALTKSLADPNTLPGTTISDPVVEEIVNNAILAAFAGKLEILENLEPTISTEKINQGIVESYPELADFVNGIKITCKIKKPATGAEVETRFKDLRFKPDMRDLKWYKYKIVGANLNPLNPNQEINEFVYLSIEPEAGFRELSEDEWNAFVDNEKKKVLAAAELQTSLPRVTQIDPSVGAEAKTKALKAIILSLIAIIGYIWFRFGTARYGFAAIAALVHDVCITLGAVTACTYIFDTALGKFLLIGDFKIDLAMIAAFLTIIGYSLNDTIVVFDRIRENRHKAQLTPTTITNSINQTLSRTLLTSFTTFIVVLFMYIFGGEGLRGFTFAIGLGIIVGTYSSVAIAAPILLLGKSASESGKK